MLFHLLQIVISSILIVAVLLQAKGSGFGAALGGMSGGGSTFRTKRGLERTLFQATILLTIVFIFISFLSVESQR
jgi:preprotein translocase subunit SecG